jgi:hypothetical protein
MAALPALPRVTGMTADLPTYEVEVNFVVAAPTERIANASGVSEVEVDGPNLRCLVCGSFQPFLEALNGHEVISLKSSARYSP